MQEPTRRQKQVLDFIETFVRERGFAPSLKQIADHMKFASRTAAEKHVRALEKKGHLTRTHRGPQPMQIPTRIKIPILGRIPAGGPSLQDEYVEGHFEMDPAIARGRDLFFLKVYGDSMSGAGIVEGDMVLVRPEKTARDGDIVVALLNGQATVKRFSAKGAKIILAPDNPKHRPIPVGPEDDLRIVGKVVAVLRLMERKR